MSKGTAYHKTCIPADSRSTVQRGGGDFGGGASRPDQRSYPQSVYRDCNAVAQDCIHRERVRNELTLARDWSVHYNNAVVS